VNSCTDKSDAVKCLSKEVVDKKKEIEQEANVFKIADYYRVLFGLL